MLRKVTYTLILLEMLLYVWMDFINLRTYGALNLFFQVLFVISSLFMAVVFIIEGVKLITSKSGKPMHSVLILSALLIFLVIIVFRPVHPHPGVEYTEVWEWDGADKTGSLFNATGKLQLSNDGRFVLKWRSLFNSWNYYGDWSYSDGNYYLRYHGRKNKRLGIHLWISPTGELMAQNDRFDFAPQVILHRTR